MESSIFKHKVKLRHVAKTNLTPKVSFQTKLEINISNSPLWEVSDSNEPKKGIAAWRIYSAQYR